MPTSQKYHSAPSARALNDALQNVPYARIPDPAFSLSEGAHRQLGALIKLSRGTPTSEVTDRDIGRFTNRSRRTVQYHWEELERAGFIERRRRYGRRSIHIRYTLAGSASACNRNKTTVVMGRESTACNRNDAHMDVPGSAHASARNCTPPQTPPISKEITTSSSEKGQEGDDDDKVGSTEQTNRKTQALEFAQAVLPPATAQLVAGDADRIASKTGRRWDCVTAAIAMLATRPRNRPAVSSPLVWIIRTAQDYAQHGISSEATTTLQSLQRTATEAKAHQARQQAAAAALQAELDKPATAEDLTQAETWAKGQNPILAALGQKILDSAKTPADGNSAK
jgi:DNA-binding MarR family transcriptional regulator